jgi:tripartite-type tricarboxylate transporter receptor subunit TctC
MKSGKLRPVAVTTLQRSKFLPDTPTIDESGLRWFESSTYTTLAIPAATPKEAVQKVRDAVVAVVAQPKVRDSFEKLGAEVVKSTPDDFAQRLKADYSKWVRIRKETGIKVE